MNQPFVDVADGYLQLSFPYDPATIAYVRSLGRAKWEPAKKHWLIPYSQATFDSIKKKFPSLILGQNVQVTRTSEAEVSMEAEEKKYLPTAKEAEITDFTFKTIPFWHQKVGFNFMRALDCSACFFEQGLGKAKLGIDLATWRFRSGQVRRVLVLCPNSVVGQWIEEVKIHGHDDFNFIRRLDGPTAKKIKMLQEIMAADQPGFIVTNYEALLGLYDFLYREQGPKGERLFQMMILDESSRVKHARAKRSQLAWKLGRTVKYRNILTGTPITQNGEDIFSQYRFLNDNIFGPYATAFRAQYLIMGGFEQRQVVGYRNISDFLKKVYSAAIRLTKDRCLDLPPKVYQKRTATLDPEVSKQYKQFEKECVAEFGGTQVVAPLVMTKIMKLSQVTGGFIYEQGTDGKRIATHAFDKNPKVEVLDEILDEVLPKKVIVWCRFTQEIEAITGLLVKRKTDFVAIHGAVKNIGTKKGEDCSCGACRACHVRKFQTDPSCQVFVGQVNTAGLGITLTAATVVVYYSNTYALEDRLQSEDRCHRIGQKESVTYIDIVAETSDGKRTIDHDVLAVLKGKSAFANEVSLALMRSMVHRQEDKPVRNPAFIKKHNKDSDPIIEETSFDE